MGIFLAWLNKNFTKKRRIEEMVEREFEVGKDEAWFANIKRTYDEYQQESLESIRANRVLAGQIANDSRINAQNLQVVALGCLQDAALVKQKAAMNSAETDNMTAKQSIGHTALATDRQWNVDEQAAFVAEILRDETFKTAITAAVAKQAQRPIV